MAIVPLMMGSGGRRSHGASGRSDDRPPNIVAVVLLLLPTLIGLGATVMLNNPVPVIVAIPIGLVLMQSPKIAQQWDRAIVLRLGRFQSMRGPGLFWVMPFVDRITAWIDQRTITTSFAAEQTLTSDTVPVN